MSFSSMLALFGALLVLAALPSLSVLTVVARTTAAGFWQGAVTALGIVVGDVVFIWVAIYGLSAIATTLGGLFFLVKYLGAAYLMVLGVALWRSNSRCSRGSNLTELETRDAGGGGLDVKSSRSVWLSSFLSGLLLTLGDQKAILFYMGFFPAFLDLTQVSLREAWGIVAIAILAVGGVKLVYAYLASQARLLFQNPRATQVLNQIAGSLMIGTGIYLITK